MATQQRRHDRQERRSAGEHDERISVPETLTRGTQLVLGSALVAHGRSKRSRRGTALALGAGLLVFRALDGPAVLKRALADRTDTRPALSRPATGPDCLGRYRPLVRGHPRRTP